MVICHPVNLLNSGINHLLTASSSSGKCYSTIVEFSVYRRSADTPCEDQLKAERATKIVQAAHCDKVNMMSRKNADYNRASKGEIYNRVCLVAM
jgi:hypothetical protein